MVRATLCVLLSVSLAISDVLPALAQAEAARPDTTATAADTTAAAAGATAADTTAATPRATAAPDTAAAVGTAKQPSSWAECKELGQRDGSKASTGGSFVGGFFGGLLLGLIGTGVAYIAQGKPDAPAAALQSLPSAECRLVYDDSYGTKVQSRKRSAALTGGLIGTAILVVVLVATSSDSNSGY